MPPQRPAPPSAPAPRRRSAALRVTLAILAVLGACALAACASLAYVTGVLERVGVVASPAERLLSGDPDREASQEILAEFEAAGLGTEGVSVMVLPIAGTDGQLAYARFDASKGFTFAGDAADDPMKPYFEVLSQSEAARDARVRRVSIGFRDPTGEPVMTMTSSSEAVARYQHGELTKEQFLRSIDARGNPSDFLPEAGD